MRNNNISFYEPKNLFLPFNGPFCPISHIEILKSFAGARRFTVGLFSFHKRSIIKICQVCYSNGMWNLLCPIYQIKEQCSYDIETTLMMPPISTNLRNLITKRLRSSKIGSEISGMLTNLCKRIKKQHHSLVNAMEVAKASPRTETKVVDPVYQSGQVISVKCYVEDETLSSSSQSRGSQRPNAKSFHSDCVRGGVSFLRGRGFF